MPQIFDEAGRENLRIQLLDNGFELIKRFGLKKTSINDITKASGIATGTFYNFFKSKEDFVYHIILHKRKQSIEKFNTLLDKNGMLDRTAFRKFLQSIYFADNNIFEYLSQEETTILYSRWPQNYMKDEQSGEKNTLWILEHVSNLRPDCNWKVFANFCKSISIIRYGKENLYGEAYDEMIDCMIETILDYVIEKE